MANVSIHIDDATKTQFDLFCKEAGISVSTAFNLFAKTVVREKHIPFEFTTKDTPPSSDRTRKTKSIIDLIGKCPDLPDGIEYQQKMRSEWDDREIPL